MIPSIYDSNVLQWIDKHKFLNSKSERFEWMRHGFLVDPLCDWNRVIAIKKSSQIGFSESFGVLKSMFAAIHYNWNIIYTLPTDSFAEKFVGTKVDPILDNNPLLASVVSGGKAFKKVHKAFIYFQGTHNTRTQESKAETDKAISITSDLNIHDESDRSDQNTLEQYESRIANSEYKGIWKFSNPTYNGVGCDYLYELSDQKVWMVKPDCGHTQWIEWIKPGEVSGKQDFGLVDPDIKEFICGKCGKVITDGDRFRGFWQSRRESDISGYWMNQMSYIQHSAKDLLLKEKTTSKQNFFNFDLGLAYAGTDIVVDRSVIIKNIVVTEHKKEKVAMGVDNGLIKWYVIGDEQGIFEVGKTKDWDVIESKIKAYDATTVIDSNPFPNKPKELVRKYPGQVFTCFYKKDRDMMDIVDFKKGRSNGVVYVQRTAYFDALVEKMAAKRKPIGIIQRELEEFIKQWESLSRLEIVDSMGVKKGEWDSGQKPDHFAHATLYQDVAMRKIGGSESGVSEFPQKQEKKVIIEQDYMERYSLPDPLETARRNLSTGDWRY